MLKVLIPQITTKLSCKKHTQEMDGECRVKHMKIDEKGAGEKHSQGMVSGPLATAHYPGCSH